MGWDDSASGFTLLKDATNSSEVFSGTAASLATGAITAVGTIRSQATGSSAFADLKSDMIYASGGFDLIVGTNNKLHFRTNDTRRMTIAGDGKVGINNQSPTAQADIRGANSVVHGRGQLYLSNTETAAINLGSQISLGGTYDGTNDTFFASIAGRKENATAGDYDGYLQFSTRTNGGNNVERMRIDSNGNVAIGTSFPSGNALKTTFHVNGTSQGAAIRLSHGSNSSLLRYDDTDGLQIGTIASKPLTLETGDTAAITIDTSQNVGIGTDSPARNVSIYQSDSSLAYCNLPIARQPARPLMALK